MKIEIKQAPSWPQVRWQEQMQTTCKEVATLCEMLEVEPCELSVDIDPNFPLRVPLQFIEKMVKGDPNCPLLRQVLPLAIENKPVEGFVSDPLLEANQAPVPGLLHKFTNRVLLTVTGNCPVHCRYCFRRHFPYADNTKRHENGPQIAQYLKERPQINEVILSGGDALAISDGQLHSWLSMLSDIESVKTVRLHSRMPIMIPERLDIDWTDFLRYGKKIILVVHCNHANELSKSLAQQIKTMQSHGILTLNQSVLLKGVNDSAGSQIELAEQLFAHGILPYYLHQLDKVSGAAHFAVSDQEALEIYEQMRASLSGYLLPRLVREQPNHPAKTVLTR